MSAFPGDLHEHLRAFALLAERIEASPRGAFASTAEQAHIDGSVLRRRVQALGAWLGGDLLAGRGAGLRVTPRGQEVAETARRVETLVDELRARLSTTVRAVSLACTGTVTTELLAPALSAARERWPDLAVRVRRAGVQQSLELIERREVGLAIVRGREPPDGVARRRLVHDRLWAALPASHRLASARQLRLRELAKVPLIARGPRSPTRQRVLEVLGPLGAQVQIEVDERNPALHYVGLGLGVSFLSLVPGHELEVTDVVFRDVTGRFPRSAFWAIWPRGRSLSECERFLVDALAGMAGRNRSRPALAASWPGSGTGSRRPGCTHRRRGAESR